MPKPPLPMFPTWVPKPAEDTARHIYDKLVPDSDSSREFDLLNRLITKEEMKPVWSEILRRKRDSHKLTDEFFHKTSNIHLAISRLFYHSWQGLFEVGGYNDRSGFIEELSAIIGQINNAAGRLEKLYEENECIATLYRICRELSEELPELDELPPKLKRQRGKIEVRLYVLYLAGVVSSTFSHDLEPMAKETKRQPVHLSGTIAHITNVVFDRPGITCDCVATRHSVDAIIKNHLSKNPRLESFSDWLAKQSSTSE